MSKKSYFLTLALFPLVFCGDSSLTGVDQAWIEARFDLSTSANPTILDVEETDICSHFEFDADNKETYRLWVAEGNPAEEDQTTFEYATTVFDSDDGTFTLTGENESGSNFELTYTPAVSTYSLTVDYNCENLLDTDDCSNLIYSDCVGPLQ